MCVSSKIEKALMRLPNGVGAKKVGRKKEERATEKGKRIK